MVTVCHITAVNTGSSVPTITIIIGCTLKDAVFKLLLWSFPFIIVPHLTSLVSWMHNDQVLTPLSSGRFEASSAEGHRESLATSEKRLILFAPTLTGPLILQVYLSSEHLALLTTWPALLLTAPFK